MNTAEYALSACVEYDAAVALEARLTREIGECVCEKWILQLREALFDGASEVDSPVDECVSCFSRAKVSLAAGLNPEYDVTPQTWAQMLDWISPLVVECPSCTRLCELLQQRREARKRLGIAKRRIRAAARRSRSEEAATLAREASR